MPCASSFLPSAEPRAARAALRERLQAFAFAPTLEADCTVFPWCARLGARARERLREDLRVVLSEPELTGEPLDWREIDEILREYAELAGWDGPLAAFSTTPAVPEEAPYTVELRPEDLRTLERAARAVQDVAREILAEFLPHHPTAPARLRRGRLKKLADRSLWQVELPDGYRLRYLVAEMERKVYVTYLGPHPDGEASGREQTVRAAVRRRQHGER